MLHFFLFLCTVIIFSFQHGQHWYSIFVDFRLIAVPFISWSHNDFKARPKSLSTVTSFEDCFYKGGLVRRPNDFECVGPAPLVAQFPAFPAKLFGFLSVDCELDIVSAFAPLAVISKHIKFVDGDNIPVVPWGNTKSHLAPAKIAVS